MWGGWPLLFYGETEKGIFLDRTRSLGIAKAGKLLAVFQQKVLL